MKKYYVFYSGYGIFLEAYNLFLSKNSFCGGTL